ncbi:MAG: dihydromonapterin reductase [Pseudomonadota bacterium]
MSSPILITGGTQRIGLAIAEDLLNQNQSVIITYRSEKPSINELSKNGAMIIKADFSSSQGIAGFIETLKSKVSSLRAIIHNASDWGQESSTNCIDELFVRMMQVHANAPYQINFACQPMLEQCDSMFTDIIHMTDYVQEKGSKKHIAYAASKAALHNLTLSFAQLFSPKIKVNSVAPALVMFNEWDDDEYRSRALKRSLLECVPGAQEAVKAVNFLIASEYITGQVLHLNGGRHLK